MPLLPDTTNDLLFSCLDPHDIIRYSRTCREAYHQVEGYWRRALDIENLLSSFFTPLETQYFRVVQALTGTLISGSMALQLLNRKRYPESDLDLYVEHRYSSFLGSFLEAIGYEFKPTRGQPNCLEAAIKQAEKIAPVALYDEEPGIGFAGVFNMARGDRKIQLITATESPLHIVLSFHSTVVMNVISYSHVYSLYPRATFQRSLSLITYRYKDFLQEVARQKYVDRGWKMINSDGSEWEIYRSERTARYSSSGSTPYRRQLEIFQVDRLRRLGDSFCWSSKLPMLHYPTKNDCSDEPGYIWLMLRRYDVPTPLVMEELRTGKQALESHTWVLSLQDDDHRTYQAMLHVLSNSKLRFTYCIGLESDMNLIERVEGSGVVRDVKASEETERFEFGFSAPLDFRVKRDLLLYDVIDEHFSPLNKGDLDEEPPDTESEGDPEGLADLY